MKNYRTIALIFYLCSVVFYVAALVSVFSNKERLMNVTWMSLGTTCLCLGTVFYNKVQVQDEAQDQDDDDETDSDGFDDDQDDDSDSDDLDNDAIEDDYLDSEDEV